MKAVEQETLTMEAGYHAAATATGLNSMVSKSILDRIPSVQPMGTGN